MTNFSNKPSHLKALLTKNWILWKRNWCISLLEIVLPILFVFLVIAFRKASPTVPVPETTYYNGVFLNYNFDGIAQPSDLRFIKDCHADKNGGYVALAPAGDDIVGQLDTMFRKNNSSPFNIKNSIRRPKFGYNHL